MFPVSCLPPTLPIQLSVSCFHPSQHQVYRHIRGIHKRPKEVFLFWLFSAKVSQTFQTDLSVWVPPEWKICVGDRLEMCVASLFPSRHVHEVHVMSVCLEYDVCPHKKVFNLIVLRVIQLTVRFGPDRTQNIVWSATSKKEEEWGTSLAKLNLFL